MCLAFGGHEHGDVPLIKNLRMKKWQTAGFYNCSWYYIWYLIDLVMDNVLINAKILRKTAKRVWKFNCISFLHIHVHCYYGAFCLPLFFNVADIWKIIPLSQDTFTFLRLSCRYNLAPAAYFHVISCLETRKMLNQLKRSQITFFALLETSWFL